ncbi:MAG TPA: phosphotransferase family protein [Candidatus Hydrogenedentes bacterium]|nr:phosphotransferase family protein [Candidatus Hydrogenedentota bacterium]HRK35229.1 phosphotransferase family protein [Candidatus Hydrogenedentota bacterium]
MTAPIDNTAAVRAGEELDIAALETYLAQYVGAGKLSVEQFPSGHSNLTYLLRQGDRELVLRRPPFGSKVKSAHDMGREFKVLSKLNPVYAPAPKPLVYCEDESVIGAKFYVMERIKGVILRGKRPKDLEITPKIVTGCCTSLIENLASLHALDYKAVGLDDLYKGSNYVERQVNGWADRYTGSQTDEIAEIDQIVAWLKERIPADTGAVLVHNDYKFDNIVLDPNDITKIIGVLDWEMATIGDPLADLGTTLGYWIEPTDDAMNVVQSFITTEPGALTRMQLAEIYAARTGRDISNILFYYVLALMKLAVIVQQIYYRYKQGLTKDERFAPLIYMVAILGRKAVASVESGKI